MIAPISSAQFPYTYSDTSAYAVDTPQPASQPAIEEADSVRISAQALAAQASYELLFQTSVAQTVLAPHVAPPAPAAH